MQIPIPGNSRHSRNRYRFLHRIEKHPRRQKDHLQQNRMRLQTTQARQVTRSAHRRRRHNQLLWRRRHFNSRYHNIQNPNQQHPFHQGRRHDDAGHQELLSRQYAATVWINENADIMLSRGNYPEVQPQRSSRRRLGMHINSKRHVRSEASRAPCKPITSNSSGTFWLLPSPSHPGTVVTQNSAYLFHARCRRFLSQIHWQATWRESPECTFTIVWTNNWLDGNSVLRYDLEMGCKFQTSWARFKTTPPNIHNIPCPGMSRLSKAPSLSLQLRMRHPRSLYNNVSQSKKSQDLFYTMPEGWSYRFNAT
jgi:hypothetical protein